MPNTNAKKTLEALGHPPKSAAYYANSDDLHEVLVRSAFLHMLWSLVVDETQHVDNEPAWIESWLRGSRKEGAEPVGVAGALQRVLDRGVDPEDLTDIVRAEQFEIIYNVCQLLDGEWIHELRETVRGLPKFSWRLYEVAVDENYTATPVRALEGLHAELGDLDPTRWGGEPRTR